MRQAAKIDANQPDIVKALKDAGMSVQILSAVGKGVPDLLVGFRGVNVLIEVKDGAKPLSAQKLTDDQANWHGAWAGQVIHGLGSDGMSCRRTHRTDSAG
jgi:hypothetical protein